MFVWWLTEMTIASTVSGQDDYSFRDIWSGNYPFFTGFTMREPSFLWAEHRLFVCDAVSADGLQPDMPLQRTVQVHTCTYTQAKAYTKHKHDRSTHTWQLELSWLILNKGLCNHDDLFCCGLVCWTTHTHSNSNQDDCCVVLSCDVCDSGGQCDSCQTHHFGRDCQACPTNAEVRDRSS